MRTLRTIFFISLTIFLLTSSGRADYGNWFVANKKISTILDSSAKKLSYRFTCQEDMALTAAAVYCLDAVDPPIYLVSLQEDENGHPSGIPLSSSGYTPGPQSWSAIPLTSVSLTKGKVYHLVVEHDAMGGGIHPVGVIGPSNHASFLSTDVLNHMHPNDGSPDPQANTLFFENGKWRVLDQEPVYAVYGNGSKFQGNPYDDPGSCPIYGKVRQGQVLHFHCPYPAKALAFRVKKNGHPTAPLKYFILQNDYRGHRCTQLDSGVAQTPGEASSDFQWVTVGLALPRTYYPECWFFVFQADSGRPIQDPPGCEDCYLISDEGNSGRLAGAAGLTFDGGPHLSREAFFTDGGDLLHWMDKFERDANVGTIGPVCPPLNPGTFNPVPTSIPLENELRFEP